MNTGTKMLMCLCVCVCVVWPLSAVAAVAVNAGGNYGVGLYGVTSTTQVRNIVQSCLRLHAQGIIEAPVWLDAAMGYNVAEFVGEVFDELTPEQANVFVVVTKVAADHEHDLEVALADHLKVLQGGKKQLKAAALLMHTLGLEYAGKFKDMVAPAQSLQRLYNFAQTWFNETEVPLVGICNPPHTLEALKAMYDSDMQYIQVIQGQNVQVQSMFMSLLPHVRFMQSRPFNRGATLTQAGESPAQQLNVWRQRGAVVIPSISHNKTVLDDAAVVYERMRQHVV